VRRLQSSFMTSFLIVLVGSAPALSQQTARWPEQKSHVWYAQQPWLVGSNYIPESAINQLEMWQEPTFDPAGIDKELTWAKRWA
jgi:hypothetical protein